MTRAHLVPVRIEVDVAFGPDGLISGCSVSGTPVGSTAPCQAYPVGNAAEVKLTRNGKPIGGHIISKFEHTVEPDPQ